VLRPIPHYDGVRIERVAVDLVWLPLERAAASAGARIAALDYVLVRLVEAGG
jgi:hypothetical protein